MGAPLLDESLDPLAVVFREATFRHPVGRPFLLRALLPAVVHAPAIVVPAGAAEQTFEVGPRLRGELLEREFHASLAKRAELWN